MRRTLTVYHFYFYLSSCFLALTLFAIPKLMQELQKNNHFEEFASKIGLISFIFIIFSFIAIKSFQRIIIMRNWAILDSETSSFLAPLFKRNHQMSESDYRLINEFICDITNLKSIKTLYSTVRMVGHTKSPYAWEMHALIQSPQGLGLLCFLADQGAIHDEYVIRHHIFWQFEIHKIKKNFSVWPGLESQCITLFNGQRYHFMTKKGANFFYQATSKLIK